MKAKVLDLRPTQFAIGMLEVDEKMKAVQKLSKKKLEEYIDENVVPVVRGPMGFLYIVDKHHFLSVCYHLDIKKVKVKVIEDHYKSGKTYSQFWKWMSRTRNCYPYCQFGEGPRKEYYLPRDIRGLADDPYRSLAWFVRKAGAFENSEKNFAEFQWANFFRSKKLFDRMGLEGFERALKRAIALAQSPAAKTLPGYGKLNIQEIHQAHKKAKKQIKQVGHTLPAKSKK